MADLSITAANVVAVAGEVTTRSVTAGATITAGQVVHLDSSNEAVLAHCETSATTAAATGIALNGAAKDQPLQIATGGQLNIGATLTVGMIYVLSTAGLLAPVSDLATNDYVTIVGVATTASNFVISIKASGVKKP